MHAVSEVRRERIKAQKLICVCLWLGRQPNEFMRKRVERSLCPLTSLVRFRCRSLLVAVTANLSPMLTRLHQTFDVPRVTRLYANYSFLKNSLSFVPIWLRSIHTHQCDGVQHNSRKMVPRAHFILFCPSTFPEISTCGTWREKQSRQYPRS